MGSSSRYSSYNCLTSWDSYDKIPRYCPSHRRSPHNFRNLLLHLFIVKLYGYLPLRGTFFDLIAASQLKNWLAFETLSHQIKLHLSRSSLHSCFCIIYSWKVWNFKFNLQLYLLAFSLANIVKYYVRNPVIPDLFFFIYKVQIVVWISQSFFKCCLTMREKFPRHNKHISTHKFSPQ